jgi:hypothetical protein
MRADNREMSPGPFLDGMNTRVEGLTPLDEKTLGLGLARHHQQFVSVDRMHLNNVSIG